MRECFKYNPQNYSGHLLKAVLEFSIERNPKKALKTISEIKPFAGNNGAYKYSEGFLLMYLEEFPRALKVYDRIVRSTFDEEEYILSQVLEFNQNQILVEPDKIQSYFILGLLNYGKVHNYPVALEYIQIFLEKAKNKQKYKFLIERAETYKVEIEKKMEISQFSSQTIS